MDISCEPSVSGAVVLSPRGPARHLKAESHQRTWFSASGRTPAPGSSSLIHKQGSSWRVPARLCVHLQRLGRWPLPPTCLSTDVQQHLSGTPPLRKACAWATILGQTVSLGRVDTALGMWGAVWPVVAACRPAPWGPTVGRRVPGLCSHSLANRLSSL